MTLLLYASFAKLSIENICYNKLRSCQRIHVLVHSTNFQFPFTVHIYREKIKYHDMEGCWGLHKVHLDWKEGIIFVIKFHCHWKGEFWRADNDNLPKFYLQSILSNEMTYFINIENSKSGPKSSTLYAANHDSALVLVLKRCTFLLKLVKFQFEELAYNYVLKILAKQGCN